MQWFWCRRQSGGWGSQGLTAGTKRSQATGSVVVGPWDAGPIDFQFARFVGDADIFGMLQANGVDEGVGHVGERDGSTHGDAALACELHEPGDKGADLVDFGNFAEFGGKLDERIGRRSGESITAAMRTAENLAEFGDRLAAVAATLIDVAAGRKRVNDFRGDFREINDFRLLTRTFCYFGHFGTPVG